MPKFKTTSLLNIQSKPYTLLGFAGFIMGILSFFKLGGDALDINLHDTYFVIDTSSFFRGFAVLLLFLWAVYVVINNNLLSKYLTWFHVSTTLSLIIFFFIENTQKLAPAGPPRRYYSFKEYENQGRIIYSLAWLYAAILALFALGQLCLLINLIGGLVKFLTKKPGQINRV